MNVVAIVQARIGSSRLPGKVLKSLGDGTMLDQVLTRCQAIEGVDAVCCAIPAGRGDDPVADAAQRLGVHVVRGSERDVLDRYEQAANRLNADVVLRVTSDCPFLDPAVAADVVRLVILSGFDYACNNMPPTWPHGFDCEAVTRDWLACAAASAGAPADREHVTPWLRRNTNVRRANLRSPSPALAAYRLTVDRPEDLALAQALFRKPGAAAGLQALLDRIDANPALRQYGRYEGTTWRPTLTSVPSTYAGVEQIAYAEQAPHVVPAPACAMIDQRLAVA